MSDYFTGCEVCEANARTYGVMTAECKVDELEEEVARLRAEVADLKAAAQWRPIEEAPKSEALLVAAPDGHCADGHCAHAYWSEGEWVQCGSHEPLYFTPTHFRSLPAAPIPALPEGGV